MYLAFLEHLLLIFDLNKDLLFMLALELTGVGRLDNAAECSRTATKLILEVKLFCQLLFSRSRMNSEAQRFIRYLNLNYTVGTVPWQLGKLHQLWKNI